MALVYVTLRIMPENVEANFDTITKKATEKIHHFLKENRPVQHEYKPVAFGLKSIDLTWSMQEDLGGTDDLEAAITEIDGVQNCECTDVRRAIG